MSNVPPAERSPERAKNAPADAMPAPRKRAMVPLAGALKKLKLKMAPKKARR